MPLSVKKGGPVMDTRRVAWSAQAHTLALVLALFFGGAAVGAYAPALLGQLGGAVARAQDDAASSPPAAADAGCVGDAQGAGAEPWVRSELFFGTAKPDGTAVTDAEWDTFLDQEITPRFPDGLTVVDANGQFREADGTIIEERTKLLILLYPPDVARDSNAQIEQIRDTYEQRFRQESVLRTDDSQLWCTSF